MVRAPLSLLIKPQAGFTHKLRRHIGATNLMTLIDGPYGRSESYSKYGNVVMFATGIGIAAQLPHIKELLRQCKNCQACTKTIHVVWQLDKESTSASLISYDCKLNVLGDQDWVRDWMDLLLIEDEGLYVRAHCNISEIHVLTN